MFSCDKRTENQSLPLPTCEGKHELGFFVNHDPWIPKDTDMYKEHELPKVKIDDGLIRISATRIDEKHQCRNWFCIETVNPQLKEGKFEIINSTCKAVYQTYYYGDNKDMTSEIYSLNPAQQNLIEFNCIDTINNIIAGRFSFSAIDEFGKVLAFESGRFDLLLEE